MKTFALTLISSFVLVTAGGAALIWQYHPDRPLLERRLADGYVSFADARNSREKTHYIAQYLNQLDVRRNAGRNARNISVVRLMRKDSLKAHPMPVQSSLALSGAATMPTAPVKIASSEVAPASITKTRKHSKRQVRARKLSSSTKHHKVARSTKHRKVANSAKHRKLAASKHRKKIASNPS